MAGPNILNQPAPNPLSGTPAWQANPLPDAPGAQPYRSTGQKLLDYALHDSLPAKAVQSVWSGLTAPGDAWAGKIAPEDMQGRAGDMAALATLGAGAAPAEANELGMGVRLRSGAEAPPTETGWTFRDVSRKPNLSPFENRRLNTQMMQPQTAEVPIRSLYATQSTVNPDFATTESSSGMLPNVIRKDGTLYVYDGHHRLTKLAEEGSQTARVNLFDFDNRNTDTPLLDFDPARHAAQKAEDDALLQELFSKPSTPSGRDALAAAVAARNQDWLQQGGT